jgi:large subunit ribosomal protein L23
MADITDIKLILSTEKSIKLQENGVVAVKTSNRVTKNSLKEIFRQYFGVVPLDINSLRVKSKTRRFKGKEGTVSGYKKFYVTLPNDFQMNKLFSVEG